MKTGNESPEPKNCRSGLHTFAVAAAFLLIFGLMIDGLSGFYVLRHSAPVYAACTGLFLLSVFYLLGEAVSRWINSKDNTTHPVYIRFFRLLMLLAFTGLVMLAAGMVLKFLDALQA